MWYNILMKNFEKKENDLNRLDRLSNIKISYSQLKNNDDFKSERDSLFIEKEQIEKKNQELIREHKYLSDKILKLQIELKRKQNLKKI